MSWKALSVGVVVGLVVAVAATTAAATTSGTLAMAPGDSEIVTCPNRLTTSGRTAHGIHLACAPNPTTTTVATTTTTTGGGTWWHPPTGELPWQWEIDHPLVLTSANDMGTGAVLPSGVPAPDPVVYDIDGFDNPASTVAALHTKGFKTICYIEVGAAENYRSDYSRFPAATLGNVMPGYSKERYVDIRSSSVVAIVEDRITMCASKGFDAIEPDIDESYQARTGFPLTQAIEENYLRVLTGFAHSKGLAMLGKNLDDTGDSYATDMVSVVDGVLSEQCNQYNTCGALTGYVTAGKPVLNAEYQTATTVFCPADNTRGFNGAKFKVSLNGGRAPCR